MILQASVLHVTWVAVTKMHSGPTGFDVLGLLCVATLIAGHAPKEHHQPPQFLGGLKAWRPRAAPGAVWA